MELPEIPDPLFRQAVATLDAGDAGALASLLAEHPRLLGDRLSGYSEGYFADPYLLWFVAENPIRNDTLPANIVEIARVLLAALEREGIASRREQADYALGLVSSGKVPRERGVQGELIDLLVEAGADPAGALPAALAHRERAAVDRLLARGAPLSLLTAACLGRNDEVARLGSAASAEERQAALAGASLHGQAEAIALLIALGVDLDAFNPPGLHAHGTALHNAVDSGCLAAVRVLVEGGAGLGIRDRMFDGTPLGWADYLQRTEIAEYLRGVSGSEPGD
jgi:peptide-methionine (S)-S-oxide reductase